MSVRGATAKEYYFKLRMQIKEIDITFAGLIIFCRMCGTEGREFTIMYLL